MNNKLEINNIVKKHIDFLKKGDLSVLNDEETSAILNFIGSIVKEYDFNKKEHEDIVYELFCELSTSVFKNINLNKYSDVTPYLATSVKNTIKTMQAYRSRSIRSKNYDGTLERLDKSAKLLNNLLDTNYTPHQWTESQHKKDFVNNVLNFISNNDILNLYYIEGLNLEQISEKYNLTHQRIQQILEKQKAFLTMYLAERGIFENNPTNLNKDTVAYIKQKIANYGITGLCVADQIPLSEDDSQPLLDDVSTILNINKKHLITKLMEDKKIVLERLYQIKIKPAPTMRLKLLLIYLFKGVSNFEKASDKQIYTMISLIKKNDFLNIYYNYPTKKKIDKLLTDYNIKEEQLTDCVIDNVHKLEQTLKNKSLQKNKSNKSLNNDFVNAGLNFGM